MSTPHNAGGGKFFAVLQVKKRDAADDGLTKQAGIVALAVYRELKSLIIVPTT